MADDHSFDVVSKIDLQEVKNALGQAMKEIRQRFDFKGSRAEVTLDEKQRTLTLTAEDDMKLRNVADLLKEKLVKRGIGLKAIDFQEPVPAAGSMLRQAALIQNGIPTEKAREIVKILKASKLKVQAAIQAEQVRVTGKSLDTLQAAIRLLKESELGIDMQFVNYR